MSANQRKKERYHHGNLAESLLEAVDELATQFGLEAVTLRGCAKLVGVSPSSAFRHYADKRALFTAFATRALMQLSDNLAAAKAAALAMERPPFQAVGLAYVGFALSQPAQFRVMWREESIYNNDPDYLIAANQLGAHLSGGFADTIVDDDPGALSDQELLAWSSVHGLACLLIDGPVAKNETHEEKLKHAEKVLAALAPALQ